MSSRFARLPLLVLATASLSTFSSGELQAKEKASPFARTLPCNDTLKSTFHPDAKTQVLMVKAFRAGDPLLLTGTPNDKTPVAEADICMVKLLVGPGNPGPEDAPSTSDGIGIEVWLPAPKAWNGRLHILGGGGWAGAQQGSMSSLALDSAGAPGSPADIAAREGAVSATTDTGHSFMRRGRGNMAGGNGSFALLPDGRVNTVLWHDFAERGIHEMTVKTKALAKAFYGRDYTYAYWDGFSTGGRQALKEAQAFPKDFDGILAGAPAINWTRFITTELNPQIVMYRDLGDKLLTSAQLSTVSRAAITACDMVGGIHLGYILDPSQCHYDPTEDQSVLCVDAGGKGEAGCVTLLEAKAFNKIWYGLSRDGSAPDPAIDNGFGSAPKDKQRWFSLTRGSFLGALAGQAPFDVASDLVAIELGNPAIATPAFVNAKADGANGYRSLGYEDLNHAFDNGLTLQTAFSQINTDNPDLSAFRDHGGKLLMYHGMSDVLIPSQGSIHYYEQVLARMGGVSKVQAFYRFYLVPGMSHAFANGTANPDAVIPLPDHSELYRRLTDWVENKRAPGRYDIAAKSDPARSAALCLYPAKPILTGDNPLFSGSYTCQ